MFSFSMVRRHCFGLVCLLSTLWCSSLFVFAQQPDATPFPIATTKKGLQVQMLDDAVALGIQHATLNISLGQMSALAAGPGILKFEFEGATWFFHESQVLALDAKVKKLTEHQVVVYAILLAYPTKQAEKDKLLLHPDARADGKFTIAGFNTATPAGIAYYRAQVAFLAARYSSADAKHGRIWGYIIGNEVNSPANWYNLGPKSVTAAVKEYEAAVRHAQQVVQLYSQQARCYLSFDHFWTNKMGGKYPDESYATRTYLDEFARLAKQQGDYEWHIAHHPYPESLFNPRTWQDKTATTTIDSPRITFKNLEVLCHYLERPELLWQGKPRRIILSEQGTHCPNTPDGEQLQAAGFVYAWEKVQRQAGIDALIWHRQVDHAREGGLRLGLWENKPNTIAEPGRKRLLYEVFQQADTKTWPTAAAFALPITGLKNWDELAR